MPQHNPKSLPLLLLAASLAFSRPGSQGPSGMDLGGGDRPMMGEGGEKLAEEARQRLQRSQQNASEIQSKFQLQGVQEAAPLLKTLQSLISQAQDELATGNFQSVSNLCDMIDKQVAVLHNLGTRRLLDQKTSGGNPGSDPSALLEQQKATADWDLQQTSDRFELLARRLQESKSPNASTLIEKVKLLLDQAKRELSDNHPLSVPPLLRQAEGFFPELARLGEQTTDLDKHGLSGSFQDSYKNQQPAALAALAQATEIYNRVHDRMVRLGDQTKFRDDSKSTALLIRVVELMDKCRDALATGQGEAAKELGLKAEALLTEWHQSREKGGADPARISGTALERLKLKLNKATEIVAAARNDKASRILEKGMEHFDRAERDQAEGQASRAQVEMDISLKLAAKAVDIARAGQNR
jgi:hypothetical protein